MIRCFVWVLTASRLIRMTRWHPVPPFPALNTRRPHAISIAQALALVEQFIAGFAEPPAALVLDRDHSEDAVHGQQPLAFYNHHDRSTCYLPLFIFDGLSGACHSGVASRQTSYRGRERHDHGAGAKADWSPLSRYA
jgi:hypothetical protein